MSKWGGRLVPFVAGVALLSAGSCDFNLDGVSVFLDDGPRCCTDGWVDVGFYDPGFYDPGFYDPGFYEEEYYVEEDVYLDDGFFFP